MSCMPNQRERVEVTEQPAETPISLDDVKSALGLTGNDTWDDILTGYIEAATDWGQKYTGTYFVTQKVSYWLDDFPQYQANGSLSSGFRGCYKQRNYGSNCLTSLASGRDIVVYATPIQSVDELNHYDDDNTATTIDSSDYIVDKIEPVSPGRISTTSGYSWPTGLRPRLGVEAKMTVGYGDAADVPQGIKQALTNLVTYQFMNRANCPGQTMENMGVNSGAAAGLEPYRRHRIYNDN